MVAFRSMLLRAFVLAISASGAALRGQSLSGALSDDTTGPVTPGVHAVLGDINVPAAKTLTLQAGAILKFDGGSFRMQGTLDVQGTAALPVVCTSIQDDTAGGDTNGNGALSLPAPGDWAGLIFDAGSGASVLEHADIRYGGKSGWSNVFINGNGVNVTIADSVIRNSLRQGIDEQFTQSFPKVTHCDFTGNVEAAIADLRLECVPGFSDNTASGNGVNAMLVVDGSVSSNLSIAPGNCLNGSLVMGGQLTVTSHGRLHLLAGVHIKMVIGYVDAFGMLDVQGTGAAPVVITSVLDDTVDGDTNNDGSSSLPSGADWFGLRVEAGPAVCSLRHLRIRYCGTGLLSHSSLLSAQSVRCEHCDFQGFLLYAFGSPCADLLAWDCATGGFSLQGGAFTLDRCTAVNNGGTGFVKVSDFTGTIRNSIAWGQGTNFGSFAAGSLAFCDGSPTLAGANGNINADPLFVAPVSGDFTLAAGSPCIDKGDPAASATGTDDAGFPRFMDGNLDRVRVVDMGAYEFDNVHVALSGTLTPGGTLNVAATGAAGLQMFAFFGLAPTEAPLKSYGPLFMDLAQPCLLLPWPALPSNVPLGIPLSLPTPLPIIVQQLGLVPGGPPTAGNLSNPVYATIE